MIDRRRVRDSFGKRAHEYENHASVQKRVLDGFLEILKRECSAPRSLLDVGSGTGMLLRSLREMYGDASAVGVDLAMGMSRKARESLTTDGRIHILTADAEHLPFRDSVFDLVVSTSTFQWLIQPDKAFSETLRVLMPGGLFCFALFGEKTLHELRASYRAALAKVGRMEADRSHDFLSRNEVRTALEHTGFTGCRVSSRMEIEAHEDVPALLRSLKRIGAGSASPAALRGLAGKRVMLDMMQRYVNEYGNESGIPATYEIIFGVGRKVLNEQLP